VLYTAERYTVCSYIVVFISKDFEYFVSLRFSIVLFIRKLYMSEGFFSEFTKFVRFVI